MIENVINTSEAQAIQATGSAEFQAEARNLIKRVDEVRLSEEAAEKINKTSQTVQPVKPIFATSYDEFGNKICQRMNANPDAYVQGQLTLYRKD